MTLAENSTLLAIATTQTAQRRLLRNDVYETLLERILTGGFAPGERLKDAQLTDWLLVSRTPVREALSRLAVVGLVKTAPNRFTLVAPLVPSEIVGAVGILRRLYPDAVEAARVDADLDLELELIAARIDRDPQLRPVEMMRRVLAILLGSLDDRVLAETIESVHLRVLRFFNLSETAPRILTNERVAQFARALGPRRSEATAILLGILDEIAVAATAETSVSLRG